MNIYTQRKLYIENIGKQLLDYQSKGFIIFDEDGALVRKIELTENGDLLIDRVIYYLNDKNLDNGYYTSIKEFKEKFGKFKIVNPKDLQKLEV